MRARQWTELARVPVRVGPPRVDGSLVPYMSGGSLMLGGRAPEGTSAPIGVNIDALVILDALDDGTVFEVEVLLPRPRWRRSQAPAPKPSSAPDVGSIVIAVSGPNIYLDRISPRCTIHADGRLHIQLEPLDGGTRWVALSTDCAALLNGDFLAGFVALPPQLGWGRVPRLEDEI